MLNDDGMRNDETQAAQPSENLMPESAVEVGENPETTAAIPDEATPPSTQPPEGQTGEPPKTSGYVYEAPWQEPVYREVGVAAPPPFSPGYHSAPFKDYGHFQPAPPKPKKPRKPLSGFAKAVCLVLACAIASAGSTYGVIQVTNYRNNATQNKVIIGSSSNGASNNGQGTSSNVSPGTEMAAEDIYAMAVNQVVGVNSQMKTNVFGESSSSAVSGSGFIISADGYIVTNYHVIEYAVKNGYELTVMMHDGKSYPAKIVGYEQDNDLAVIKIDQTGLSAVTIGSSKNMQVGDRVFAVGNPLGELDYTMTNGIVSALDRVIPIDEATKINMFQIDAAVNPGNSGGPVYNSKGEIIGIVSAKYASSSVPVEGLGFAIPIDDAMNIITQLMTTGHVSGKPSMGITVSTVTSAAAQYYNWVEGAYVNSVEPGSCADKAGIKVGDIITKLGDTAVTSSDTLKAAKKNYKAGETAKVTIRREGKDITLSITFDEEGVTQTTSENG
ncbi:trypsin-like peptidase domain-containing protein [Oscillospiraceae bacterium CM]|nr:trypsin-like peptidase domain-containing protein [Oscillospiraceae bacterium CM]